MYGAWRSLLPGVLLLALAGCSSGGPHNTVSGTVTYKGAPVPYGKVVFEPDTKGAPGVQGIAEIRDGHYQTFPNAGTVGGAYKVHITGFTGPPAITNYKSTSQPLFPEYITLAELPDSSTQLDFDVPERTGGTAKKMGKMGMSKRD